MARSRIDPRPYLSSTRRSFPSPERAAACCPFTSPGKDHTAHRLSNLGLGHRGAVLLLYCVAALGGATALLIPRVSPATAYALAGIVAVCGLTAVLFLEGAPYERQAKLQKSSSASSLVEPDS